MNTNKLFTSYVVRKEWHDDLLKRYPNVGYSQHDNPDYLIATFLINDSADANKLIDAIFWISFNYGFSTGYDSCLSKMKESV